MTLHGLGLGSPVVGDGGVVAAVVLRLGHRHLELVEVRRDHVGRQTRHPHRKSHLSPSV